MRVALTGVLTLAASLGAAQTAFGADLPTRMPTKATAPVVAIQTWTGCYVGGNVGGGWSQTRVRDEITGDPIASLDATAVVGGGQIGCDYQFAGGWVIGLQGMLDASGLKADTTSVPLGPLTLHGSIPWLAMATARIGYVVAPDWLVYAKGGGAWTHTDSKLFVTGTSTVIDSVDFNQSGWTAGVGAEWRFAPHFSVFVEYNYLGFADKTVSFPNSNNIGVVRQNVQVGLVGMNFRF